VASVRFSRTESSGMMPSALRSSERKAIPASMARHGTTQGEKATFEFYGSPQVVRPRTERAPFRFDQTSKPDDFAMPHHRDAVEPVLIFESFRLRSTGRPAAFCGRPANAVTFAHLIGF